MGDEDEVMRFEITDQDLEDEMSTSYGRKRMSKKFSFEFLVILKTGHKVC